MRGADNEPRALGWSVRRFQLVSTGPAAADSAEAKKRLIMVDAILDFIAIAVATLIPLTMILAFAQ
jgi:hypothetical protein